MSGTGDFFLRRGKKIFLFLFVLIPFYREEDESVAGVGRMEVEKFLNYSFDRCVVCCLLI